MKKLVKLLGKNRLQQHATLDEKSLIFLVEKLLTGEYGRQGMLKIKVKAIKEGRILFKVANDNWANELWETRKELCDKLNTEIGAREFTEIGFVE